MRKIKTKITLEEGCSIHPSLPTYKSKDAAGCDLCYCGETPINLSKGIKDLKKQLMDIVEDFREKYDAIQVVVDIEMYKWDTDDNCCDVSIKV